MKKVFFAIIFVYKALLAIALSDDKRRFSAKLTHKIARRTFNKFVATK